MDISEMPQTEIEWLDYIRANKLVCLGHSGRAAYALDDQRVVKVSYDGYDNRSQFEHEIYTWNTMPDEIRKYFATIYAYGDNWVVMERAWWTMKQENDFYGKMPNGWNYGLTDEQRELTTPMFNSINAVDMHSGNIGYFGNGQYKIIDYGL